MNRAAAFNQLVQDFKTWMTANYPAVPVQYPDVEFQIPTAGNPWVRLNINWSGSVSFGTGSNQWDRHTGMLFAELYFPSGEGFGLINAMAAALAAHFRAYSADGGRLKCGGSDFTKPTISTPPSEPGWTRRSVDVPIRLTEQF